MYLDHILYSSGEYFLLKDCFPFLLLVLLLSLSLFLISLLFSICLTYSLIFSSPLQSSPISLLPFTFSYTSVLPFLSSLFSPVPEYIWLRNLCPLSSASKWNRLSPFIHFRGIENCMSLVTILKWQKNQVIWEPNTIFIKGYREN